MTSPKQDKRPKTLIEYMGLKDPDLFLPDHDKWCLKLYNNKKLCRKILFKIIMKEEKGKQIIIRPYSDGGWFECFKHDWQNKAQTYFVDMKYETFEKDEIELEHILVKHGSNGFSQRLGFVDVYYKIELCPIATHHDGTKIDMITRTFNLFFEIKTKEQSVGSITREIEYYRDAINEIKNGYVIPVVISPKKIPIDQFNSFSFDEILQLEKELE